MPSMHQLFVAPSAGTSLSGSDPALAIDRLAFVLRKRTEHEIDNCYFVSLSARTITYKGMLTSHQLTDFFPDLSDERVTSGLALVHSRFSTNTFPSWPLAHPYRYLAHNGEINTLAGNRNWMRAREALCRSDLIPGLERAFPIVTPGASDSASFDEVLELLHLGGRPLHHAVLMMIPEAWENHRTMDPARRAFYRYHAALMEPWDGPAAVAFTDGTVIGAVLDRNGLRPARYWVTDDGLVVLASEVGVLEVPAAKVVRKGRLQPGRMFLVDTALGRMVDDDEIKDALAAELPYAEWLDDGQIELEDLPPRTMLTPQHASVIGRQRLFGYTNEELRLILQPMARTGSEPNGSMGTDTAIAVLSDRPRLLYDYFTQLFAQVTNPPLDAIREELVTSLMSTLGPEANLLEPTADSCRQIVLPMPVIDNDDLAKLLYVNEDGSTPGFRAFAIDGLFEVSGGGEALRAAIEDVRAQVSEAIAGGADVIVLSDRNSTATLAPIPSLLLVAAVHHHLVRNKTRTQVGLVIESGDAREVHHMALLKGFGAAAINPYLAFESIDDMIRSGDLTGVTSRQAQRNYIKAASKGIIKVMSKMGISTVASYTGAQVFEAVGLAAEVVDEYFTGTVSRIGGVGLDVLAEEVVSRHRLSHLDRPTELAHREREVGGEYQWRREGRDPPLQPEDRVQAAARHPVQALRGVQGVHQGGRRAVDPPGHPAGDDAPAHRRAPGRAHRRGGAERRHPGPVLHRGHVLRVDLRRGPRDPGHRHEPARGAVEHRGGGRGLGPVHPRCQRRPPPERHQTGGLGPVRGDLGVPGQRGRHPDQDRPGGQARRGGPAGRDQGLPVDRQDPLLHPGGGPHLAPAPPRHLLHRGHRPAHPRPQVGQSARHGST